MVVDKTSSAERYRAAVKQAKRYVAEQTADASEGLLPVLETILPNYMELSSVKLGIVEAPMSKIRGTVALGRASAFAGNFLPLLPEHSEFGLKWIALYNAHLNEGIREPGVALEYLGFYYILEGHKRVSVLKALDSPSVQLDVTRLMPAQETVEQDTQARIYMEIIEHDSRRPVINMWFSAPGSYTELRGLAAEYKDNPEGWLDDAFVDFRSCYVELGLDKLSITTADAFLTFAKVYGIPYHWEYSRLTASLRALERQLLCQAGETRTHHKPIKPKIRHAIFVYEQDPRVSMWDAAHDYGRRILSRTFPDAKLECITGLGSVENPDQLLSELCGKEAVMFVTEPSRRDSALRAFLSQKETLVCNCRPEADELVLPSYYGRTAESAFILGALAGAMTKNGAIGIAEIPGLVEAGYQGREDTDAFALGASMVNDQVRVLRITAQPDDIFPGVLSWDNVRCVLARHGCDMVLTPCPSEGVGGGVFPGMISQLAALNKSGCVSSYLGASAWNFGTFYCAMCAALWQEDEGILKSISPGSQALRFESGLDGGLIRVHITHAALKPATNLLVSSLVRLIKLDGLPNIGTYGFEIETVT